MPKVRPPKPGESISWRPKHRRLSTPKAAPAPKPIETPEERQRQGWKTQVDQMPAPSSPWPPEDKGPGILDNIEPDPHTDPEGYGTVLRERIRRMLEN